MSLEMDQTSGADEQTRQELIHQNDGALVFAAAGSGKTTTVVDRIVNRLTTADDPITPAQLVAITFTRAAAAELKHRIGRKLAELALNDASETATRARHALDHLHEAMIGTIDSFAADLARNAAVFLDIPTAIEVLDEVGERQHHRSAWVHIRETLLNTPKYQPLLQFAFTAGLQITKLRPVALELARVSGLESLRVENALAVDSASDLIAAQIASTQHAVREQLRTLCAAFDRALGPQHDDIDFVNRVRAVHSQIARVAPEDHLGFLRFATDWNPGKRQLKFTATERKAKWPTCSEADRARLEGEFAAVYRATSECLQSIRADMIGTLGELIRVELLNDAKQRNVGGQYTYSEITQLALRVVRNQAAPCRTDVREIIVDEVQDTDPRQVEFLQAFIERVRITNTSEHTPHVVLIGDPRQSIYSFRGADPDASLELGSAAGPVRSLDRNFRSRPEILDWIAGYFERVAPDAKPQFGRSIWRFTTQPSGGRPSAVRRRGGADPLDGHQRPD